MKFLNSVTENTLRNNRRRELLEKFPIPSCDPAHPPKVHAALMGIVPKPAKRHDRHLSNMQQFAMDALGPLTWLYEQLETAETVDRTKAKLAAGFHTEGGGGGGGPGISPPPSHNFPPPEILKLSMIIIVAGEEPGYQAIHQT